AGLDADRALSHALLELLQRDGNGLVFRALDRGVVVDLDGLTDPAAVQALSRLRAAGVEPVVKLASTELGLTNVYAVGVDTDPDEPISATACGEAAHPDREVAVRKALLELCSSRARKAFAHGSLDRVRRLAGSDYLDRYLAALPVDAVAAEEPRALAAMASWLALPAAGLTALLQDSVLSNRSQVRLADLPTTTGLDTTAALRADVVGRLHNEGMDVLVLDLSGDGVHVAKAVVPGLEVETMSYGRIGERGVRRARDLGLPFVAVGADPGGWTAVHLTDEATERLGGPAWLDRAAVDAAVGALYPLYREPARHLAQLALSVAM
ncbi:MAG: YcaO-like family protein, partial [Frankiales bacterium]|nr:YcaO-like family protein [Frankiales bacterium]